MANYEREREREMTQMGKMAERKHQADMDYARHINGYDKPCKPQMTPDYGLANGLGNIVKDNSTAEVCLKELYEVASRLEGVSLHLSEKLNPICAYNDSPCPTENIAKPREYPAYFTELQTIRWNLDATADRLVSILNRCAL